MKWLKLKRTFKEGARNFSRNGWLTFATVTVLGVSLYIISLSISAGLVGNLILKGVQDKINISIYFSPTVEEDRVNEIKEKIESANEVKSVEYISKEQALEDFMTFGEHDPVIVQALEEIGENPLLSSLVIKAHDSTQYRIINESIEGSYFRDDLIRINYDDNEKVIDRLNYVIMMSKRVGAILAGIFIFIGILITFNAIRLTMYSQKREFEIMRLVGASNLYIKMPYIFEGALYGIVSGIVVMGLLFATTYLIHPLTRGSIPQGDIISLFLQYFWIILPAVLLSGITLGVLSSYIAIRKYLKI